MAGIKALLALAASAHLLTSPLIASDTSRYLIATKRAPRAAELRILRDSDQFQAHAVRPFDWVDAFGADLTNDEVAELKRSPEVRFVTPVVERQAFEDHLVPQATNASASVFASSQTVPYGVTMVHAPDLWRVTRGSGAVNVAILDTGIDTKHPDLMANLAGGYNTFTKSSDPTDDNGHGTHVAGTIAAMDNSIGVVGVAPEARIWSVKVLDNNGSGADENIIAGIDWVISKKHEIGGDWIVSLSLGSAINSPVEQEAFKRVVAEGIITVAAAGNRSLPDVEFPAQYPGVIAVGAVDATSTLAMFSDHGPHLGVVAPGVAVLSTARTGSIPAAGVALDDGMRISASPVQGSVRGEVVGSYTFCGLGKPGDFSSPVNGTIAVIERGELTFNEKVRNAQAAGAVAVVIYNNDDSDTRTWTLLRPDCATIAGCDDPTHPWPVVLAVTAADGKRLLQETNRTMDMGSWLDDYTTMSGTSMAAPHVSGVAALLWSLNPTATADRVREVLLKTAIDLGDPGVDNTYGYGLVDALSAARELASWRFDGSPAKPPSGRTRPSSHP